MKAVFLALVLLSPNDTSPRTIQIVQGSYHTCALFSNGKVKCWGVNGSNGALGLGDTMSRGSDIGLMGKQLPFLNLAAQDSVKSLSAAGDHTCALFNSKRVKCWGEGEYLGLEDRNVRGIRPDQMGENLLYLDLGTNSGVTEIQSGFYHNCSLHEDRMVRCWGIGEYGLLGRGDKTKVGGYPGSMGSVVKPVDLGTGEKAKQIVTGKFHTCALLESGKVKCWGYNNLGILGLGDEKNRGSFPEDMGDKLPNVNLGSSVVQSLASGSTSHGTCVILSNGDAKCWGVNFKGSGALGLGPIESIGNRPNDMGDQLPKLSLGAAFNVKQISLGAGFSCAVSTDGRLKCWGSNADGQLGLGDLLNRGYKVEHMGDQLPIFDLGLPVLSVSTGETSTCAILINGEVKCWGNNEYGNLGIGDTRNRGTQKGDMGENLEYVPLLY